MKRLISTISAIATTLVLAHEASAQRSVDAGADNPFTCSDSKANCISAVDTSSGAAILGISSINAGGNFVSTSGTGVEGYSAHGDGVYGRTDANAAGVAAGFFTTSAGSASTTLAAENLNGGTGLYAQSDTGYAGYFSGKTNVHGCFQIDEQNITGCTSDARLKKNISPLTGSLDKLLSLKGVNYEWTKPEENGRKGAGIQTGFIAQEVEKVFPSWVDENRDGFKTLTIAPNEIAALEVESIRALKAENDALKDRVKALELGRRPLLSGFGEGGVGLGMLALAGAMVLRKRKNADSEG